ncbi:hypothetical protein [Actinomadura violacea]|uniref:hypothetical protein n=1 Tax=Actinomadura violacea TaxID=2819934 RepID=UPI001E51DA1F|nr:hypothetical protein [Actinomadura violacea]
MLGRGHRSRVPLQIGVQTVGDLLISHTLADPDLEDGLDDRSPYLVGDQDMLGGSLFSARGHRVRNLLGHVPVRRPPDIEALPSVDLEPTPGLLQHLQDVPLGNALLDAPGQHLRRALAAEADRLIGRPQRDADLLQPVLDLGTDISATRDPVDGLADHRVEPPIGLGRLGQQVLDTAITRHGDVEALMPTPEAARLEVLAPRLDVVEVRDDHCLTRERGVQRTLAVGELARERQGRVLLVLGRGPSRERHPERPGQPESATGPGQAS